MCSFLEAQEVNDVMFLTANDLIFYRQKKYRNLKSSSVPIVQQPSWSICKTNGVSLGTELYIVDVPHTYNQIIALIHHIKWSTLTKLALVSKNHAANYLQSFGMNNIYYLKIYQDQVKM